MKNCANTHGSIRIVVFLTSPISDEDKKALPKLANRLKKENVSVTVVLFGEIQCNQNTMNEFIEKVNKQNTSRLLVVSTGLNLMTFVPRLTGESDAQTNDQNFAEYGGIDPSVDPELALIMQQSLQEAKDNGVVPAVSGAGVPLSEDEELQRAMQLSLAEANGLNPGSAAGGESLPNMDDLDPELKRALELSLLDAQNESNSNTAQQQQQPPPQSEPNVANVQAPTPFETDIQNEDFVRSLLNDIDGVDAEEVMKELKEEEKKKKEDKK